MSDQGWKYVNGAMMPTCLPLSEADTSVFNDKNLWKKGSWKRALFARYSTSFGDSPGYWYWVVKDSPLDVNSLKGKLRYEIKRSMKEFYVEVIDVFKYAKELYEITVDAYSSYPKTYSSIPTEKQFLSALPTWKTPCFGAFYRETGRLCGYINIVERENIVYYSGQAVLKEFERLYVNTALVYGMLYYYEDRLANKQVLIVDGEKNILHKTNHQEFLVKKLGFKKIPCDLKIVYRPTVKLAVCLLYPLRKLLLKIDDSSSLVHKINGVLEMERIIRLQKRAKR